MPDALSRRGLWEHTALLIIGIGGPLAYSMASPIYSSGDEAAHVDYALQVWQGRLPVFEDGLVLDNTVGVHPPVQWTAQHPPLLYLLLAPVVGPLVAAGHVNAAGVAARLLMVIMSVALVYAVRYAARQLLPSVAGIGLASAAVIGVSVWFIRLGGSVYNDTLAALTSVLAFGTLAAIIRRGSSTRLLVAFALACGLAAMSRLSLVPIVGVFAMALAVAGFLSARVGRVRGLVGAAAAGVAMTVLSGWFYVRNLLITGSVSGGHPDWAAEHTTRVARPALEVVADPTFWRTMLQQFSVDTYDALPVARSSIWGTLLLFLLPTIAGAVLYAVRAWRSGPDRWPHLLLLAAILVVCGGIVAMQVLHTAGGGSSFPRYFFAMIPFVAPLLALALLRAAPLAIAFAGWLAARLVLCVLEFDRTLSRSLPGPQADNYPVATWIGVALLAAGCIVAAIVVVRSRRGAVEESTA